MVPQSVLFDSKGKERSAEERNMNDNTALARATSAHFPALAMLAEQYNVCVIFLNQLRTAIGVMFGDPRKTTGGNSPEFYYSQRIWLSSAQIKDSTGVIGAEVTGKFMKNKVARPFLTAKWRFMFDKDGTGHFDRERSLVEFLANEGILPAGGKAGSVVFDGKTYAKETLARTIEKDGRYADLVAMLPKAYDPPVVASVETDDPESDVA